MVDKYEIKNSTSFAKHGRLTYSDPSLMKISSSSMRAISTVTSWSYSTVGPWSTSPVWPRIVFDAVHVSLGWSDQSITQSVSQFIKSRRTKMATKGRNPL